MDMINQRFGRLSVLREAGKNQRGFLFECLCDCGNKVTYVGKDLRSGNNKSCGCLNHRMSKSRIYQCWANMKRRCNDPKNKLYHNYGGRGITYCKDWEMFDNFYRDMKDGYSDELTLDRVNNDKNYSIDNCRWATRLVQANNQSTTRHFNYEGESYTVTELAEKMNFDRKLLHDRLSKGMSLEKALKPIEREELTFNNETKTVTEFANENGMTYHQLKKRLMRGWDIERALTQPLRKRN